MSTIASSNPLQGFQKIGHNTWLSTPPAVSGPLILLCSWMDAAPKHIAKYTLAYQRLYPNSPILLVTNNLADWFRSPNAYRKNLKPAISVLQKQVAENGKIVIHSFSNGGAKQLIEIATIFKEQTEGKLPYQLQVMDSSPGKGDYKRSHAAMMLSLPRNWFFKLFGSFLLHAFLVLWGAWAALTRSENDIHVIRRQLNDENLFDRGTPRVYLFSKADSMVGWDEIEEHADDAEKKGWKVKKVRFENSPHAGHVREDEGKYWGAIQELWPGSK